jgi:hypothetical protein
MTTICGSNRLFILSMRITFVAVCHCKCFFKLYTIHLFVCWKVLIMRRRELLKLFAEHEGGGVAKFISVYISHQYNFFSQYIVTGRSGMNGVQEDNVNARWGVKGYPSSPFCIWCFSIRLKNKEKSNTIQGSNIRNTSYFSNHEQTARKDGWMGKWIVCFVNLFNNTSSAAWVLWRWMGRWLWMTKYENVEEIIMTCFRVLLSNCLDGLRKTTENLRLSFDVSFCMNMLVIL